MSESIMQAVFPGADGLTQGMKDYLATQGIQEQTEMEKFVAFWAMFSDLSLDAIVGSFMTLRAGRGQERKEPFTPPTEPEGVPSV
jgi:hypothetical protein